MATFQSELEQLINRYSMENYSDTPDFILAQYLEACLTVYGNAIKARDDWYGFTPFADLEASVEASTNQKGLEVSAEPLPKGEINES